MEGFSYHDIFATKGIEYIIIISFLVLLIPFWIFVNKPKLLAVAVKKSLGVLNLATLKIPKGVFYNKNHTWAYLNKSGVADIGIDDWLLHITGQVEIKHKKQQGEFVKQGDHISNIISNGKELAIHSPISGTIVGVNSITNTEFSDNLYNDAWFYKLEPQNWKAETQPLYFGNTVKEWMNNEILRFKDFISAELNTASSPNMGLVMQEGGELRDQLLHDLPKEVWISFQKEFLIN